jgi:hypothetical protein
MASTVYRKRQEEVEREVEASRQRAAEARLPPGTRMQMAAMPQKQEQQQQSGMSMNPSTLMDMQGMFGNSAPNAALDAWTGIGPSGGLMGSGSGNAALNAWTGVGPGASGASSAGGSGFGSGMAAAGPWAALAAAIALNENYQGNIGNREGESFPLEYGLTGRAFYKDKEVWGDKADDIIPGLGSGVRIAGGMSSPVDLFRGDTYKDLFKELKSGGMLGGILKGLF